MFLFIWKKKLAYPNSLEVVTMVATLQPQVVGCCFAPSMYWPWRSMKPNDPIISKAKLVNLGPPLGIIKVIQASTSKPKVIFYGLNGYNSW